MTLELKKAKSKWWDDVKEKKKTTAGDSAIKKKGADEGAKDPSSSLMDMMKELY